MIRDVQEDSAGRIQKAADALQTEAIACFSGIRASVHCGIQ